MRPAQEWRSPAAAALGGKGNHPQPSRNAPRLRSRASEGGQSMQRVFLVGNSGPTRAQRLPGLCGGQPAASGSRGRQHQRSARSSPAAMGSRSAGIHDPCKIPRGRVRRWPEPRGPGRGRRLIVPGFSSPGRGDREEVQDRGQFGSDQHALALVGPDRNGTAGSTTMSTVQQLPMKSSNADAEYLKRVEERSSGVARGRPAAARRPLRVGKS